MKTKKSFVTIGELVEKFKKFYPDISASKIRFLESKGLVEPKRTPSKYRVFSKEDIIKINFILRMQKEYYLPLEAIKEKLNSLDFKLDLENKENKDIIKQLKLYMDDSLQSYKSESISIYDLMKKLKIEKSLIDELVENNIIILEDIDGQYFIKSSDIEIVKIVIEFLKFGIRPKHLRFFENFSFRESSFIQQIVLPVLMSESNEAFKKANEIVMELEKLIASFRTLMVKRENRLFLEKYK
ncbi:MAG: MerR family transcriptional regulator [Actinobacteria bacterium]|nr:MerR family transcriptional regulator [Cyanobacteriota bacterium]MCL5772467.1 MerR family transcriptional regulator [Actinomycetota bacterium]